MFFFLAYFTLYNRLHFIHLIRTDSNVFFLMAEQYSIVYTYHSFLIHSSADGHLGWFHVLAIMNGAVMNIGVHVSLSIRSHIFYEIFIFLSFSSHWDDTFILRFINLWPLKKWRIEYECLWNFCLQFDLYTRPSSYMDSSKIWKVRHLTFLQAV